MSKSKDKGRRFEHQIADTLTAGGIPAKRVFMSGQLANVDECLDGDVRIIATGEKIEGKHRENINKDLWLWLEGNSYLALKRNNQTPLMVMTLEQFVKLYKGPTT